MGHTFGHARVGTERCLCRRVGAASGFSRPGRPFHSARCPDNNEPLCCRSAGVPRSQEPHRWWTPPIQLRDPCGGNRHADRRTFILTDRCRQTTEAQQHGMAAHQLPPPVTLPPRTNRRTISHRQASNYESRRTHGIGGDATTAQQELRSEARPPLCDGPDL